MKDTFQSEIAALSERGQMVLHQALDQGREAKAIARMVWLNTRESVSEQAITHYASVYRRRRQAAQEAQEKLDRLLAQARADGIEISDLLRSVLKEKLTTGTTKNPWLREVDVLKLEAAERQRSSLDLRREQLHIVREQREREIALKERGVALQEERFREEREQQKEKARAQIENLERKAAAGKRLTTEDMRDIRAIYGIYDEEKSESEPRP